MVLGLLKPLLTPAASNAAPNSAVAKAAAAQQAAAQQSASQPDSTQAQPEGVRFDLSDKALQLVEEAAQASAPPAAAQAVEEMSAAVQTLTAPPTATATAAPRAATASAAKAEPEASVTTAADSAEALDPTEEERARAWAIRGMEREKLLNLVETLKVTPRAEPAQKEVAEYTATQAHVRAAPASDPKAVA